MIEASRSVVVVAADAFERGGGARELLLLGGNWTTSNVTRAMGESHHGFDVRTIYPLMVPFMIVVLILAILGNGVIVMAAPRLTPPVSPYLRLCISLAAADMWAASLIITGLLINSYLPIVLNRKERFSCAQLTIELFRVSGMLTSVMHLFALAINQLIGTLWPLRYKTAVTTRRIRLLVVLLWTIPIIFTSIWFLSFEEDGLRTISCTSKFYNRFPFRITVFLVFTLPLFATLIIYFIILTHLMRAKAEFKASAHERQRLNPPRKNHVNSKLKLVWTTLLIVSTFCLSWGLCVLYFMLVCTNGCPLIYMRDVPQWLNFSFNCLVNLLVMFKLAGNPFIYTLRIRAIRRSVELLFASLGCQRCCRQRSPHYTAAAAKTIQLNSSFAMESSYVDNGDDVTHPAGRFLPPPGYAQRNRLNCS